LVSHSGSRDNSGLSGNNSFGGSSGGHNSLFSLEGQCQEQSQGDQSQKEDGKVPSGVSSPLVSQISSVSSGRAKSSEQWDSSSEKSVSLVSVRERSKGNGGEVEVLVSGESSVSKVIGSSLSLVVNVLSNSGEVVLRDDELLSIETSSIVDSVGLVHANSKDKDGSKDQKPCEESRDDHEGSVSSRLSSVLVGSEMDQVDKEQPGQPGNDHQDEDRGVNPLKRRVVLVDLSSSDARAVNEAVGSMEETSVGIE